MVVTRSQARLERSSGLVASQGVDSPLRCSSPLQTASSSSGPVAGSNGLGGTQVPVAGGYYVEWRRGGRRARAVPKFPQTRKTVLKERLFRVLKKNFLFFQVEPVFMKPLLNLALVSGTQGFGATNKY